MWNELPYWAQDAIVAQVVWWDGLAMGDLLDPTLGWEGCRTQWDRARAWAEESFNIVARDDARQCVVVELNTGASGLLCVSRGQGGYPKVVEHDIGSDPVARAYVWSGHVLPHRH